MGSSLVRWAPRRGTLGSPDFTARLASICWMLLGAQFRLQARLGARRCTHFIWLTYYPHLTGDPDERTHGHTGSEDGPRATEGRKRRGWGGGCTRAKGAQAEWAWGSGGAGSRGSGRNPAVEAAGANQPRAHTNLIGHLERRDGI